MFDFLLKIWNWFNGSKTKIGALCLAIAALLPDGVMVFGYDLKVVLVAIGGFFGVVGVAHMAVKADTKAGQNT
jgi:hypothetical protein